MKIVEAYRWGEADLPEWLVWDGNQQRCKVARSEDGIGGWRRVTALGEQMFNGELVNIVEVGVWCQALRPGPAPRSEALV
jgi:hypothetical protein